MNYWIFSSNLAQSTNFDNLKIERTHQTQSGGGDSVLRGLASWRYNGQRCCSGESPCKGGHRQHASHTSVEACLCSVVHSLCEPYTPNPFREDLLKIQNNAAPPPPHPRLRRPQPSPERTRQPATEPHVPLPLLPAPLPRPLDGKRDAPRRRPQAAPPRIEAAPADYVTAMVDNSTGQSTAEGT